MPDSSLIIILGIFLFLLILLSAFFSAFEAAITSLNRFQFESYYKKRKKNLAYKISSSFLDNIDMTISTILTGNNLVAVGATTLSTIFFTMILWKAGVGNSEVVGAGVATGVMTLLLLIFGEFIPKSFARRHNLKFIIKTCYFQLFFYYLFWPISRLLTLLTLPKKQKNSATEDELHTLVGIIKNEGVLDGRKASLIKNAINFDEVKIGNIMTRLDDIVHININWSLEKIAQVLLSHGYSRFPVKGTNNKFIGMITFKAFFSEYYNVENKKYQNFDMAKIVQPILFISQYIKLDDVLQEMQVHQLHLCLVKKNNDSSKIIGIVSLENIIEAIVGKIYDETDNSLSVANINDFTYRIQSNYNAQKFFSKYCPSFLVTNNKMTMLEWFKEEFKIRKIEKATKRENDLFVVSVIMNKNNTAQYIILEKKSNLSYN